MAFETSESNYTVGKGQAWFNRKSDDGKFEGRRNLGNVVSMSTSVSVEKLDHFSTKAKYRNKDKSVVIEVSPKVSLTLDEINAENFALLFLADLAEKEQQASLTDEEKDIAATDVKKGYAIDLGWKFIDPANFTLTDDGGNTTYVADKDYKLDARTGMLHIYINGDIEGATALKAKCKLLAKKYKVLTNFQRSSIEGELFYASDNAAGSNQQITFWSVSFTPTGETVLITEGAEWMQIQLEGEIQGDNANHPGSPYGQVIITE